MQHCPTCIRKALAVETKACPALCDGALWDYLYALKTDAMASIPMSSRSDDNDLADDDKTYLAPFYLAARTTDLWFVEGVRATDVYEAAIFRKKGLGKYRIRCEFLLCTKIRGNVMHEVRRETVIGFVDVEVGVSPIDAVV